MLRTMTRSELAEKLGKEESQIEQAITELQQKRKMHDFAKAVEESRYITQGEFATPPYQSHSDDRSDMFGFDIGGDYRDTL